MLANFTILQGSQCNKKRLLRDEEKLETSQFFLIRQTPVDIRLELLSKAISRHELEWALAPESSFQPWLACQIPGLERTASWAEQGPPLLSCGGGTQVLLGPEWEVLGKLPQYMGPIGGSVVSWARVRAFCPWGRYGKEEGRKGASSPAASLSLCSTDNPSGSSIAPNFSKS